jgi:uncharacterized UPF0160 family protein
MKTPTIITHDGVFHADEVLAIALLRVFTIGEYSIYRTRDERYVRLADIAIDVGGVYCDRTVTDHGDVTVRGQFDHHQFNEDNPNYGLSSAGLIWRALGSSLHIKYPAITKLVHEVDQQDTGAKRQDANHFASIVSSFNGADIGRTNNTNFEDALKFVIRFLENIRSKQDLKINQELVAARAKLQTANDVIFAVCSEWVPATLLIGKAHFAVSFDTNQGCWTVSQVPVIKGKFGGKYNLEQTGLKDEVFTHKAGFVGKYGTDKSSAINVKINGTLMSVVV